MELGVGLMSVVERVLEGRLPVVLHVIVVVSKVHHEALEFA